MVRETLYRQENDDLLLQPTMLETGLQTPHDGAKDGAAPHGKHGQTDPVRTVQIDPFKTA